MAQGAVLKELTKGTLICTTTYTTGLTVTADTEVLVDSYGDANNNVIIPYLVWDFGYQDSGVQLCYEWYIFRNINGAATVNFSDSATLERWIKDKKIFDRGIVVAPWIGGEKFVRIKRSFFNVSLEPGEYICLMIRPVISGGAGNTLRMLHAELRKLEVSP